MRRSLLGVLGLALFVVGCAEQGPTTLETTSEISADAGSAVIATPLQVLIDIKPGGFPNTINCNNVQSMITVAILGEPVCKVAHDHSASCPIGIDISQIDHASVQFEGAGEAHVGRSGPRRHVEDVNEDFVDDLVFHFRLFATSLDCNSVQGTLTGELFDGTRFEGSDVIRMLAPPDNAGGGSVNP